MDVPPRVVLFEHQVNLTSLLQLREDLKKGVYVENLTEYNVTNVNDVVKLLLQVVLYGKHYAHLQQLTL